MTRVRSESGFGLTATILMLIIFAILGIVGLAMARQELHTQVLTTSREVAFYAAETGLAQGVENWTIPQGLLSPGTSWTLDEGSLPNGASYRVSATKLDDNGSVHPLYALRSEGEAGDGRTRSMGLLIATVPLGGLFEAALTVRDSARLAGSAEVMGFDTIPTAWLGTFCSVLGDDAAGLLMGDTLAYELQGSAELDGAPALEQLADTTGFFDFGDVSFAELAAAADAQIAGGTVISNQVGPTTNADGSCKTSDKFNWGDPENPGAPCGNWLPVIYADGDLAIESQIYGQGVLLVEGDLSVQAGATFYGPVVVKGALHAAGNFTFYGGVRAAETSPGTGSAAMYYSGCTLERALSQTRLAKPRALTERPWFQRR